MTVSWCKRLVAALIAAASLGAAAQSFPDKPIRFVIPYPPGGTTDVVGRAFATQLSKLLGQPVVVDNRSGAAGSLGTEFVARAAPDGYTLGMSSVAPFAANPACNPKVPYDPVADFKPITELASSPHTFLVNASFPAKNYAEFLALIKASPGKYSIATGGTCSNGHMVVAGFMNATGTKLLHVPYRGAGPAIADVLANQVPIVVESLPSTTGHIKSGALRPIVIASSRRFDTIADVPTFAEVGIPEISEASWYGLVAPARTPDAIIRKLHEASVRALQDPGLMAQFAAAGAVIGATTPEQHAAQIRSARDRLRALVKAQNITPDN